jgi:hypothetical protein
MVRLSRSSQRLRGRLETRLAETAGVAFEKLGVPASPLGLKGGVELGAANSSLQTPKARRGAPDGRKNDFSDRH